MAILETERILFRQHLINDLDDYYAMKMDVDVWRYVGGRLRTREEAEEGYKNALAPARNRMGLWVIVLKNEGNYIGRCGIYPNFDEGQKQIDKEASLGLYIASAYGKGVCYGSGPGVREFDFEQLQLHRIVAMIDTRNIASIKLVEKLGFVQ